MQTVGNATGTAAGRRAKKGGVLLQRGIMSYRSGDVAELAPTSNIEYW